MADIKTQALGGSGITLMWIDMDRWNFRPLSDQWNLRVTQLEANLVRTHSDYDPYAFAALPPPPAWMDMNLAGRGFGSPGADGFPTTGVVDRVVMFAHINGLLLDVQGLNLPAGEVISAFREGRTSDLVAMFTAGNDVIQGASFDSAPFGLGGTGDVISGGLGDDTILGHGGTDTLRGGDGDDLISTIDRTSRTLDPSVKPTVSGADVDGGAGVNTISYADAPFAITADLTGAAPGTDVLKNIQRVIGGDFADVLTGSSGANYLSGGHGSDTIKGGDGGDTIEGGLAFNQINGNTGEDSILGQSEVGDWLLGGQGNDVIDATASSGHNIINGNLGSDTIRGSAWGDDILRGGQGDDDISAFYGKNWISGDLGHNTLRGGLGADTFHAGAGDDVILNFSAENGDHVQVDPGVRYTAQQTGEDVSIVFDNGGRMLLQQTYLVLLPAGWIVA